MTPTASKPLCQELHDLLGWEIGVTQVWLEDDEYPRLVDDARTWDGVPAYDFGYLFLKLRLIFLTQDDAELASAMRIFCQADSAADSLARLVLELAKAGILKREGE